MKLKLNRNERNKNECMLVSDGKKLYLLPPIYRMPKGVFEIREFYGEKVYQSNGKLMPQFRDLQKIQPRNNTTFLLRSIRKAIVDKQLIKVNK